jgi:hypothetical protein
MICQHCEQKISYRTLQCPGCSGIQWRSLIIATFATIIGLVIADVGLLALTPHPPHTGLERKLPVIALSARQLYKIGQIDTGSENRQLAGHTIQVSGVVTSVAQDFVNHIVISLRSGHILNDQMTMSDLQNDTTVTLQTGERIVLDCSHVSSAAGVPEATGCTLVKTTTKKGS